jgi:hypothetical protein
MDLNEIQFNYTPATGADPRRTDHLAAMHEGRAIGQMTWHPGNGQLNSIAVDEGHRRQGLALDMMRHVRDNHMPTMANGKTMPLTHSPYRDPDGEKFAQATKGEFYAPKRIR